MYLWPLLGPLEIFLAFFIFLRSLIPKKSSGMQKPYVWLVTPPTKNQHKNSILVHCVLLPIFISVSFFFILQFSCLSCFWVARWMKEKESAYSKIWLSINLCFSFIVLIHKEIRSWKKALHSRKIANGYQPFDLFSSIEIQVPVFFKHNILSTAGLS